MNACIFGVDIGIVGIFGFNEFLTIYIFFRNVYLCPFKALCLRLSAFLTASIGSFNSLIIWKRSNVIFVVGKYFVKPDIKAGDMSIVACSICSGWTPLFSRCSFQSLIHVSSLPGVTNITRLALMAADKVT